MDGPEKRSTISSKEENTKHTLTLLTALLLAPLAALHAADAPKQKPNILVILADDLGETKDLAAQQPERAEDLRARLDAWRKETDANMPRVKL